MGCGFSTRDDLACWFGNLSAFIYFLCNFPQLYLNFKRRSTKGFSNTFVIMKIFGLSFLVANSAVEELPFPIQLAGILLLFTSVISTIQIAVYNRYYSFLLWLSLPFIVLIISYSCPNTIEYSKWINPAISLISYIPLLSTCISERTTYGISVFAQHLNFIGSIFGLLMCQISSFCGFVNWVFYFIGIVQASLVYFVALYFGEMRLFDSANNDAGPNADMLNLMHSVSEQTNSISQIDNSNQDIIDINVEESENEKKSDNEVEKTGV